MNSQIIRMLAKEHDIDVDAIDFTQSPPPSEPTFWYCRWCGMPAEKDHDHCPDCEAGFARGWLVDRLAGRAANGMELDGGRRWHALKVVDGEVSWTAMCGAKPGRRSAGWSSWKPKGQEVTCPRCLAALAKL